jgi:hypothetical protein
MDTVWGMALQLLRALVLLGGVAGLGLFFKPLLCGLARAALLTFKPRPTNR